MPSEIGQAHVKPLEPIGQPLVIEPEQMQQGGVEVVDVHRILDRGPTQLIGLADDLAALQLAAGQPNAEAVSMAAQDRKPRVRSMR